MDIPTLHQRTPETTEHARLKHVQCHAILPCRISNVLLSVHSVLGVCVGVCVGGTFRVASVHSVLRAYILCCERTFRVASVHSVLGAYIPCCERTFCVGGVHSRIHSVQILQPAWVNLTEQGPCYLAIASPEACLALKRTVDRLDLEVTTKAWG
ncbi:hypothetical protein J6590_063579 [Homalodisca vitripennis]|nr:hypothetical protein J6590_063579 [Homalodisca vitripennis]